MAEFRQLIITKKGQALMAKMIAGTGSVQFTKVGTSETVFTDEEILDIQEVETKQVSLVSKVVRTNEVAIRVESEVNNLDLTHGYMMNTIILYAEDPDEGEIVYAACGAAVSGYMPPYNGISASGAYFKLITTVGNAENVTLEIDPAAVATIGDINYLQIQIDDIIERCFSTLPLTIYVNADTGDDANEGSLNRPIKTISEGVRRAKKDIGYRNTLINVANGVYNENVICAHLSSTLTIIGESTSGTIINGYVHFHKCRVVDVNKLTINAQQGTDKAINVEYCETAVITNTTVNHNSYNTSTGECVAVIGSKVHLNVCSFNNAYMAISAHILSDVMVWQSTINTMNTVFLINAGSKVFTQGTTKTNYGALTTIYPGSIFLDNKYIDVKTTNITN